MKKYTIEGYEVSEQEFYKDLLVLAKAHYETFVHKPFTKQVKNRLLEDLKKKGHITISICHYEIVEVY